MVSRTEWSGLLFFEVNGHPVMGEKFEAVAREMYMQDVGSHSFTGFKNGTSIIELYERNEKLEDYRMGIIHSHHGMETFYSHTDMSELVDNVQGTDFYLSLIVNNHGEYIAKVIYKSIRLANTSEVVSYTFNGNGAQAKVHSESLKEVYSTLSLIVEVEKDQELFERVFFLEEEKRKRVEKMESERKLQNMMNKDSFKDFRKNHGVPGHVSERQMDMFSGKTLLEQFETAIHDKDEDFDEISDEEMEQIALSCLALEVGTEKSVYHIAQKLLKQIENENEEALYILEFWDTIDEIIEEMTGVIGDDDNYLAVLEEIITLTEHIGIFEKLRGEIMAEIDKLNSIEDD